MTLGMASEEVQELYDAIERGDPDETILERVKRQPSILASTKWKSPISLFAIVCILKKTV